MSVLLSAVDLAKSYSHRPLFSGLTLELQSGEKVGLIGPNGAGKSTLLKILAGLEVADAGTKNVRRGARLGYLPQDDIFAEGLTCREAILEGLASDNLEDHERETRTAIILTQFGFADHDQVASTLSGGWRKRLGLARELAREPDFLLLDEPTNHLDLPGVLWLEKLLRGANFGYLAATHDRAFLRAIAQDVIEVSRIYPGGVFRSTGGFETFAENRDRFMEAQEQQQAAVANQVRKENDWLGRKAAARTRKASSRIEAASDRRDELAELKYRTSAANSAGIDFVGTGRQTRKLLSATGLTHALGGRTLFENVDLILSPGMKLGLLGANGSGKSTLLKDLALLMKPDRGIVTHATGVRCEVFEQGRGTLDLTTTLRRALAPNAEMVMFQGQPMHVAGWAKRFLFQPEQLDLELSALSGGEQARVRIAQLMLRPADVLFLDEPTNDLDIPALEVLEDSLAEFPGAVVLVSHDRELMDRLCTEYLGLESGVATSYGSVSQWLTAYEKGQSAAKQAFAESNPKSAAKSAAPKGKKLSYKEQQEFEQMEGKILEAEDDVQAKQAEVERASTLGRDQLTAACQLLEAAQAKVETMYARWQELEARRAGS